MKTTQNGVIRVRLSFSVTPVAVFRVHWGRIFPGLNSECSWDKTRFYARGIHEREGRIPPFQPPYVAIIDPRADGSRHAHRLLINGFGTVEPSRRCMCEDFAPPVEVLPRVVLFSSPDWYQAALLVAGIRGFVRYLSPAL